MVESKLAPDLDEEAADAFEALATYVVSERSVDGALQLIVDLAGPSIGGAEAVGISLKRGNSVVT
ncbi:MAG TPA: hypothetical protein VM754_03485, partial [Actinomycetota bacterium]|nr:hypothetical protein [Actinomycetota bacterium]